MVPHVNRQEVYAGGKWIKHSLYDENKYGFSMSDNEQMNVSPIDLFKEPKSYAKQFPHYKNAARNLIYVEKGDCLFMPAFYYYQLKGYARESSTTNYGHMSTIVSLQFRGNSELLNGFWDAIEKNILK